MYINCFIILKTYGELHPIDPPLRWAPWFIVWHAFVSPLLNDFAKPNHLLEELILAYPWTYCLFALRDCSQLDEMSSRASLLMTSLQVVPDPLCGKT
jgi:hypothetical protein